MHVQAMCQNYNNKHNTQMYMKCNHHHGYNAQVLIALQITLECAHVMKTEISNNCKVG